MTLLQQSPYPLAIVGACVAVLGLAVWQNGRRGLGGGAAAVGLLLIPAAWAIDNAYVTDAERLTEAVETLVADFKAKRSDAVQNAISDTRSDLQALAGVATAVVTVKDERLTDVRVSVEEDRATVRFRVNADFKVLRGTVGGFSARRPTLWELKYEEEPGGWKIVDVADLDPISGERQDRYRRL